MAMRAKPGYFSALFDMCRDNAAGLRAMFEEHKISPDFDPDGPLPLMPNKRNNWRNGFIRLVAEM